MGKISKKEQLNHYNDSHFHCFFLFILFFLKKSKKKKNIKKK